MKVVNHRLLKDDGTPFAFRRSPNQSSAQRRLDHRYLVIHYTAGASAESSISWLTNKDAKASAHLVIGRDGEITQLVAFNRVAWHAGVSRWLDLAGLNSRAIGIELDNPGVLTRAGNTWRTSFGRISDGDEVMEAVHKNEIQSRGWHLYTPEQLDAALEVSSVLAAKYDLSDVLGHDDISPGRKTDPGPAFPMTSFRARVLGREEDEEVVFETMAVLNIRTGPGSQHPTIEGGPLPRGTRLDVQQNHGNWRFVDVLDTVNGVMDLDGWVHGRYIRPVP